MFHVEYDFRLSPETRVSVDFFAEDVDANGDAFTEQGQFELRRRALAYIEERAAAYGNTWDFVLLQRPATLARWIFDVLAASLAADPIPFVGESVHLYCVTVVRTWTHLDVIERARYFEDV